MTQCTRDPETVTTVDITLQAYRALRIIEAASAQDGTLTLPQAGDLVRGNGGGSFSTKTGKNNKAKGVVNVKEVAGGKVTLNKDETESMLLKLLVDGYLKENFANSKPYFLALSEAIELMSRSSIQLLILPIPTSDLNERNHFVSLDSHLLKSKPRVYLSP